MLLFDHEHSLDICSTVRCANVSVFIFLQPMDKSFTFGEAVTKAPDEKMDTSSAVTKTTKVKKYIPTIRTLS